MAFASTSTRAMAAGAGLSCAMDSFMSPEKKKAVNSSTYTFTATIFATSCLQLSLELKGYIC